MVHVLNEDTGEGFMINPRPNRSGRAWVVRHRGPDIWMYRSPDPEDVPASVVFRYAVHECWLNDSLR